MMDFTLKAYQSLLSSLKQSGYTFQTFEEFLSTPVEGRWLCFGMTLTNGLKMLCDWHKWSMPSR